MWSNFAVTVSVLFAFSLIILIFHQPAVTKLTQTGGQPINYLPSSEPNGTYLPDQQSNSNQPSSVRYTLGKSTLNQLSGDAKLTNNSQLVVKPELKKNLQQGLLESGQFNMLLAQLDLPQLMTKLELTQPLKPNPRDPTLTQFDPEVEIPKHLKYLVTQLFDFTRAIYQLYEKRFITNHEIIYPTLPASASQQLAENEFYVLKYFQELIKPINTLARVRSYQMTIFNTADGQLLQKALFLLYGRLLAYFDQSYSMSISGDGKYELIPAILPDYTDEKWANLISMMSKINGKFYSLISQYQTEADNRQYDDLID